MRHTVQAIFNWLILARIRAKYNAQDTPKLNYLFLRQYVCNSKSFSYLQRSHVVLDLETLKTDLMIYYLLFDYC
jgi:hypothetical protein